jgi:hypothetical protein
MTGAVNMYLRYVKYRKQLQNSKQNVEESQKMIIKERQSESGHWYARDGSPAYTVLGKNGQPRNTTLRDARSNDLVPSVSGILNVAAKPGLDTWKQQQVLLAALTLPRKTDEPEQEWLERVMMDSKQTGRVAAERGTAIHAIIQEYFEGKVVNEYATMCDAVKEAIDGHFGKLLYVPEVSFAHQLGYGGKADLIARAADNFDGVCIDFKTKETEDISTVDVYAEHGMQLAAYREGFKMPKARCANVFVGYKMAGGNVVFTGVKVIEHDPINLDRYWLMFTKLLEFWQLKNNHS